MPSSLLSSIRFFVPAAGVALLLFALDGQACVLPSAEQRVAVDELLVRTHRIVLAEATEEAPKNAFTSVYTLKMVRQISGPSLSRFDIVGSPRRAAHGDRHFNNHSDEVFWKDNWAGRVTHSTDCKLYPSFEKGGLYLVFIDEPYHVKGFERILDQRQDKWLDFVQRRIKR